MLIKFQGLIEMTAKAQLYAFTTIGKKKKKKKKMTIFVVSPHIGISFLI
jgi:hypothetical protein